jgi:hypothetical protein
MNKLILAILLTVSLGIAQDVMRIKNKDGSEHIIPIGMIAKITFDVPNPVQPQTESTISHVLKTFTLLQNYPNPFNPETQISFTLPRQNKVTVRIYDVTGRLVKALLDETRDPGSHRVQWNGTNAEGKKVSSGMYLYEVRYERSVQIRKMMMVK